MHYDPPYLSLALRQALAVFRTPDKRALRLHNLVDGLHRYQGMRRDRVYPFPAFCVNQDPLSGIALPGVGGEERSHCRIHSHVTTAHAGHHRR
jgi:hypothetical protein